MLRINKVKRWLFCRRNKHKFKQYMGVDLGVPYKDIQTVSICATEKCENCGLIFIRDIEYREVSVVPPKVKKYTKVHPDAKDVYFE